MDYPKAKVVKKEPDGSTVVIDETKLVKIDRLSEYMSIRSNGSLAQRCIFLSEQLDWVIARDADGYLVVIPLKK